MYILALDSTSPTATVAVSAAEAGGGLSDIVTLKGIYTVNTKNTHSETLLPMIETVLKSLSLQTDDIGMFAYSEGPGSFTGVRIGASVIKGLAFGRGKICVGVSAIEALAANLAGFRGIICPVMNARRSQLYAAVFSSDGKSLKRITEDSAIPADELKTLLESVTAGEKAIYFAGDGYSVARAEISLDNIAETPEMLRYQNAYSVSVCAFGKYRSSENKERFTDTDIAPVYLRPPQAERERIAQKKNAGDV